MTAQQLNLAQIEAREGDNWHTCSLVGRGSALSVVSNHSLLSVIDEVIEWTREEEIRESGMLMIIWVKGVGSEKTKSSSRVEGHSRDLPPRTGREKKILTLAIPKPGRRKRAKGDYCGRSRKREMY
ncbi:hypothetical protein TNCV_3351171 [Trichonephila clavipes]|nr:hypothetical protein TNCV_3351171 [Trichonephila clavipes]